MNSKVMYGISLCVLLLACYAPAAELNGLAEQEKQQGFKLLFDGTTMEQWRNYRAEGIKVAGRMDWAAIPFWSRAWK